MFLFPQLSYQEQANACYASCSAKGKSGSLVRRDGPYSPKPGTQSDACVCY